MKSSEILSTLLYYGRVVDSTLVTTIGKLATQQAKGTQATMQALTQLLDYCTRSHPDAIICFTGASNMILAIKSNVLYLSVSKAWSHAVSYFYLMNNQTDPTQPFTANGAIQVLYQIIKEVLSNTSEAELNTLFHNTKEAYPPLII